MAFRKFVPSVRSYGTSTLAPATEPKSTGKKDATFTTTTPSGFIDLSGFRVKEILPYIGRVFPSGGTEGGGRTVGFVIRQPGVGLPALEDSYSHGAGLIYDYYTPNHPKWAEKVDLILRLVELSETPASTPAPTNTPAPVSGNQPAPQTTSATPEWVWPALIFGSGALVAYLLSRAIPQE